MDMALLHKQIMRGFLCSLLILGLGLQTATAADLETVLGISKTELEERILGVSTDIDIRYHSTTEKTIIRYTTGGGRPAAEKMLGRTQIYFSIIEEALNAKGLPEIIKYIPIIESDMRPDARSRAGALGLWQFMKPTAKMYDLTMTGQIDERMNPRAATDAATDYLQKLYNQFGDWTLAIAAYNCGPGNVRKAMRRSGKKTYWGIRAFLPKETRYYIPKLIAAAYLMKYYNSHNMIPAPVSSHLINTSIVNVFQSFDLKTLANDLLIDESDMKQLNSVYSKGRIPANSQGLELEIPTSRLYDFYALYQPKVLEQIKERELKQRLEKVAAREDIQIESLKPKGLPVRIYSLSELNELHSAILNSIESISFSTYRY